MGSAHSLVQGGELQFYELKKYDTENGKESVTRRKIIVLVECYLTVGAFLQECIDLDQKNPKFSKKKKKKIVPGILIL